jgi:hypothetical protein
MRRPMRLIGVVLAAALLLRAAPAWAPFHLAVVEQVFFGTADCPDAQYIEMRMLAAGQNLVQNQRVQVQNADGSAGDDFGVFAAKVPSGTAGGTYVIGTAEAAALFGITVDQETGGRLPFPDGRVCFGDFVGAPVDCVAYGAFSGDNGGRGAPAAAPALGMALVRQSNTSDNANDFAAGPPAPRNNAGDVGVLGTCPAETTPTATPEAAPPTPTALVTPGVGCVGDCNADGSVAINELILGVNIALGSEPLGVCPSFDCSGTGAVPINCLISAVAGALNGCPSG